MIGRWALVCAVVWVVTGCVPADDAGGGGGVGSFSRGFVFVKSDRNVYLADSSNYRATPIQLTTDGSNRHPSLSRDGRQVVYVHAGNELDIVRAASGVSPTPIYSATGGRTNFKTPVFSSDQTFVVFAYDLAGTSYVGRVNVDGSGFTDLTSPPLFYGSPSFYPTGSSVLAVAGQSSSEFRQLVRVDVLNRTTTAVAGNLGSRACAVANRAVISPDGSRVAFDGRLFLGGFCGSATRIFVMNVASGNVTQLTDYPADPGANDGFPTWVGNDQIGFSSNAGGADQIYVLQASASMSSGRLQVPSGTEPYYGPN
jgi:TolB protein